MFNKNQKEFQNNEQYEIWKWGVHILPLKVTLPCEFKNSLDNDMVESCIQMQKCLLEIMEDMYNRSEPITPRTMFRFFIELNLCGELEEYTIIYFVDTWNKKIGKTLSHTKDKDFNARVDMLNKALDIAKIKINKENDKVIISSKKYPKMFLAMHKLAKITLKEKGADNSFTYCDFRYLNKKYKYDKIKNATVFLSDNGLQLLSALDDYATTLGLKKKMDTNFFCKNYSLVYYYKNQLVLRIFCGSSSFASHAANLFLRFYTPYISGKSETNKDLFFNILNQESEEYKSLFFKNIHRCILCNPNCGGEMVEILEKKSRICSCHGISIAKFIKQEDMPFIKKMIKLRVKAIDIEQY